MSRYDISYDNREIVVGWDPPLGTFFAQEHNRDVPQDEDDCIWWVGLAPREIPRVEELVFLCLEREITIPDRVVKAMLVDAGAPWEPGPLQRMFGFTGKEN